MTDKLNVNTVIELNTMEINFLLNDYIFIYICIDSIMFKHFICAGTSHEHTRVFIPDFCKAQSINRHFSRKTFRVLNLAEQSDWLIFLRKNGIVRSGMPVTQNKGEGFNVPWLFQYTNFKFSYNIQTISTKNIG